MDAVVGAGNVTLQKLWEKVVVRMIKTFVSEDNLLLSTNSLSNIVESSPPRATRASMAPGVRQAHGH